MTAFEYVALDDAGKRKRGVVDADSARAARKELRGRKLTLLELNESRRAKSSDRGSAFSKRKLKAGDLVLITRQLAMLVRAGTPVEEALGAVASQSRTPAVRDVLSDVRAGVTEGFKLSDSLARQRNSFGPLYRSVVAAGEASGDLGVVMERLAEFLEQGQKMRRQAMAAVIYPVVLAVVATIVVTALMIFVVPKVVEQFDTIDQDLPLLTEIVIAISETLQNYGIFILGGLIGGAFLFAQALRTPAIKRGWDALVLRLPVIGPLNRSVNSARFARTMGTLVGSGAPVMESLAAAKTTATNKVIQSAVEDVTSAVREGGALSGAMAKTAAFPPLLVYMVGSGERGGDLAGMFTKGAEYLESEFESAISIALNLLEPLIIVFMGGIVATIVLAIMLPILQLNTLATL